MQEFPMVLSPRRAPGRPLLVERIDHGEAFVISSEREPPFVDKTYTFLANNGSAYIRVATQYDNDSLKTIAFSVPGTSGEYFTALEMLGDARIIMVARDGNEFALTVNGTWLGSIMYRPHLRFSLIGAEHGSGKSELPYKLAIFNGAEAKVDAETYMQRLLSQAKVSLGGS